jgi:glutathione S-transferase
LASHIALTEADAEFEAIRIDFGSEQQRSAGYLALNPKGRVPALVTERGVLTETPAILAFIAQSFPAAALAPLDDPYEFAQVQAFNSYLCSTVHVAHAHKGRGNRWASSPEAIEDLRRKAPQTVGECFALIEGEYFKGPWVRGENYTVCDAYLLTLSNWLEGDGLDRKSFPKVHAHAQRMMERPGVKRAIEEHFA